VEPGGTFVYELRPARPERYHTHAEEHRQLDPASPPLVIEPAGPTVS
jgi:hypothetical protein